MFSGIGIPSSSQQYPYSCIVCGGRVRGMGKKILPTWRRIGLLSHLFLTVVKGLTQATREISQKKHMMTQMWFCWNPIKFHCPLFVLLLINIFKTESLLWECIYRYKGQVKHSSTKILVWGCMFIGSCPKEAQSILYICGLHGFQLQASTGPRKQLQNNTHTSPKPAGSD